MPWRGPEVPGEFPTLGYLAADWIEENLVITDGPKLGQPFRLYDEQLNHLLWKYRLDPKAVEEDGNDAFQFGGSMIVRGQKWGKDPLLAAIDLFHAFGPCDFAGWDANGEPVGKPHPSPWVAVAALNDKQTDNTWIPLREMAKLSPEIVDTPGVEVYDTYVQLPCGNPIEPLTTTAWGRLGGRFTKVSITENGVLTGEGDRGGLAFARTLKRSVSGMNGMWTAATNTWDPTELSDAQLVYEAKDPHVFVDAKLSRKHVDLANDDELRDEIIYLYGDSIRANGGHVSEQRIMRDCRNKANGEAEVRRFFLSEILAGEKAVVEPARWEVLARPEGHEDYRPLQAQERITLGFDGSRSRDATVLTACRISDGRLFHQYTWVPSKENGFKIPRTEVDQAVRDLFAAYDVWYLYADPFKWQDYLDQWAGDFPKKVVEVPTNEERRMDKIIQRFTDALATGDLTHDPTAAPRTFIKGESDNHDDDLTRHLRNAALKKGKRKPAREDDAGQPIEHYLKVAKKREGLLIDATVSAMLAYDARGQAIEDGALVPASEGFNIW
jgi:hypothetical protein